MLGQTVYLLQKNYSHKKKKKKEKLETFISDKELESYNFSKTEPLE